mgnify:CR=1 FL=1
MDHSDASHASDATVHGGWDRADGCDGQNLIGPLASRQRVYPVVCRSPILLRFN